MSDCIVQTDFQGPGFVAVPNHVADDDRLSADALGVLVWMAAKPAGFTIRRASILKRFGFGPRKWQRIRRELIAAGAATPAQLQDPETGRMHGESLLVRWPEKRAEEGRDTGTLKARSRCSDRDAKSALPDAKKASGRRSNRAPYKEQEEDKGARARARADEKPAPASRPDGRGAVLDPETFAAYLLDAYPGESRADWLKRRGRTDEG